MDGPRDYHIKWSKRKTNTYNINCVWNLKYDTNELVCKTKRSMVMRKQTWLPIEKRGRKGINQEFGISRYNLLDVKQMNKKLTTV